MRKERVFEYEIHCPTSYPEIEGWNEEVTETAGFVPLEVRFKQMEQAGIRARFFESEFSSKDVSDMYLNHPEFDLSPEDDIEDAMEKIQLRQAWISQVKDEARKRAAEDTKGSDAAAPSQFVKEAKAAVKAAENQET